MPKDNLINTLPARSTKPIITVQYETPEQVQLDVHITRDDLKSTQKEGNVFIFYQVSEAIADGKDIC